MNEIFTRWESAAVNSIQDRAFTDPQDKVLYMEGLLGEAEKQCPQFGQATASHLWQNILAASYVVSPHVKHEFLQLRFPNSSGKCQEMMTPLMDMEEQKTGDIHSGNNALSLLNLGEISEVLQGLPLTGSTWPEDQMSETGTHSDLQLTRQWICSLINISCQDCIEKCYSSGDSLLNKLIQQLGIQLWRNSTEYKQIWSERQSLLQKS